MANKILFLCTGNYYRSRFAEILFNSLISEARLDWKADSRGLALEKGINNSGPISKYVWTALERHGIKRTPDVERYPLQVRERELEEADLIIALKKSEHRTYLSERYPHWVDKVEYWDVTDRIPTTEYDPLQEITREIKGLIQRLRFLQT